MMEQEKRCTGVCWKVKFLGEFPVDKRRKDGHASECKICASIRRYENILLKDGKIRPSRVFTETEKNIFKLGVSAGEARCRDLEKACNIQMRANKRLFEIIKGQDRRGS